MAQNLTIAGAASLPFEDGTNVASIQLAASLGFSSRADFSRSYTAAVVDDVVDFGTLGGTGAKGIIVKCTSGACTIKFQSNTSIAWPLAPGGYFVWINPSLPFPTAAFVNTTGAATVVFVAVG